MRRLVRCALLALGLAGCQSSSSVQASGGDSAPVPTSGVGADVYYLASPALMGRGAGTPGADSAAEFIARRYRALSLLAIFPVQTDTTGKAPPIYFQFFRMNNLVAENVGAVVTGTDSVLRGRYIVVGAHFDHLGLSPVGALDPRAGLVIRPGADDNASGTAAVLELASRFARTPARRSVMFLNFGAEEAGLVGSHVFVGHSPVPIERMDLMVNLDMVGRLRDDEITIDASGVDSATRAKVATAVTAARLRARYSTESAGRSDYDSFLKANVRTLSLSTGTHGDYHRVSDVPSRINVPGLIRVVDVAEAIVRTAANRTGGE